MNFALVFKSVGRAVIVVSFAILFCTVLAIIYHEPTWPFIVSFLIAFGIGLLMGKTMKQQTMYSGITRKDAYLIVSFSWILIGIVGALPYLLTRSIPSVIDSVFESVSGFTTTGSSILTDIEGLPKSILFWRSLTHWIGGIGIITLFVIVMPSLKIGGHHLFSLESSVQDRIKPKIKSVGYRLFAIYVALTVSEIGLLLLGKMNLFESVCHAFGTVATGGFSPKNTSIADYSPYIQYVVMIFMLLAGMNFAIHYYILKRDFDKVHKNDEVKAYLGVIALLGIIITLALFFILKKPLETSIRESFFQVISIVTCTGYATADYLLWPGFAWVLIFFAMFLGGSTGSTAGGIKIMRHVLIFKNLFRSFKLTLSPHRVLPIRLNGKSVKEDENRSILAFVMIYLAVFLIGSLVLVSLGLDGKTSAGSVATCMAGIGPGIGTVGPASNFAHLPGLAKIVLTFLMIVGRLEIYTVLILFTPIFWKK